MPGRELAGGSRPAVRPGAAAAIDPQVREAADGDRRPRLGADGQRLRRIDRDRERAGRRLAASLCSPHREGARLHSGRRADDEDERALRGRRASRPGPATSRRAAAPRRCRPKRPTGRRGHRVIVVPWVAKAAKSKPTKPGPRSPDPRVGAGVGFSVNGAVFVTPPAESEIVTCVGAETAEAEDTENDATGFPGSASGPRAPRRALRRCRGGRLDREVERRRRVGREGDSGGGKRADLVERAVAQAQEVGGDPPDGGGGAARRRCSRTAWPRSGSPIHR